MKTLRNKDAVYELFDVVVPEIDAEREGGYTRITRLGNRKGDNAPLAEIEIIIEPVMKKAVVKEATQATKKAAEKVVAEAKAEEVTEAVVEAKEETTEEDK